MKNEGQKISTKKDYIKIEEILAKKGLLTKESVFKDVIENKLVKQLGKTILAIAFVSGVIVVSAAAPNLFGAFGKFYKNSKNKPRQKINRLEQQKMMQTIYNLQNKKLIEWDRCGDKIMLKITPRGRSLFFKQRIHGLKIAGQKDWDKIWRVVIFDIPNNLDKKRDAFRQRLKNLGFFQFQKSAFLIPYPCRPELEATLEYYELFDYVTYLEANQVSGEEKCRQYFNL